MFQDSAVPSAYLLAGLVHMKDRATWMGQSGRGYLVPNVYAGMDNTVATPENVQQLSVLIMRGWRHCLVPVVQYVKV